MSISKKIGFFKQDNKDTVAYFDNPSYGLTETISGTDNSTVTFNFTSNLTSASGRPAQPTIIWNISGNVAVSDFIDAEGLTNTITLPASGNFSITKNLDINSDTDIDFTFEVRTSDANASPTISSNVIYGNALQPIVATGGTINLTSNGLQQYHVFNANASFDITNAGDGAIEPVMSNVDILVVGGGGAGGFSDQSMWGEEGNLTVLNGDSSPYNEPANAGYSSGGGGAGEVITVLDITVGTGSNTVVVGAGGTCALANADRDGANTTFMGQTAGGGGGGGNGFLGWPGGAPVSASASDNSGIPGYDANANLSLSYNISPYSNVNLYTNSGRDGLTSGAGGGGAGLNTKDVDIGRDATGGIAGTPGTGAGAGGKALLFNRNSGGEDWEFVAIGGAGGGSTGDGSQALFNGSAYRRPNGGTGTNASVTGNVVTYGTGGQGGIGPMVNEYRTTSNVRTMPNTVFENDNTPGSNVQVAGAVGTGNGGGAGANGGSGTVVVKYVKKRRNLSLTT